MPKTIHLHPLVTSALAGDELLIWDDTNSLQRRITKANFLGATFTGGGTIATGGFALEVGGNSYINGEVVQAGRIETGGFTLVVPATGTAMLLGSTQTVTGNKTFSGTVTLGSTVTVNGATTFNSTVEAEGAFAVTATPNLSTAQAIITSADAARRALRVNIPSSPTTNIMDWCVQNVQRAQFNITDTVTNFWLMAADLGSARGPTFTLEHNNNGSTPAAGTLFIRNLNGTGQFIWPDISGKLRIGTTSPTNANDTSGTVVGDQTSMAAAKEIDVELPDYAASLGHIRQAVQDGALRSWRYKSGAYNNEHFPVGLVVDYAPRYGMDLGRSLNVPVAIGDLFAAVAQLAERVEALDGGDA